MPEDVASRVSHADVALDAHEFADGIHGLEGFPHLFHAAVRLPELEEVGAEPRHDAAASGEPAMHTGRDRCRRSGVVAVEYRDRAVRLFGDSSDSGNVSGAFFNETDVVD